MVLYTSNVSFNNEETHNKLMEQGYKYEVHYAKHTGNFGPDWGTTSRPYVEYLEYKVAFCTTEEEAKAVKEAKEALESTAYVNEVKPLVHKKKKDAIARYCREMRKIEDQMEMLKAKYSEYGAKLDELLKG